MRPGSAGGGVDCAGHDKRTVDHETLPLRRESEVKGKPDHAFTDTSQGCTSRVVKIQVRTATMKATK